MRARRTVFVCEHGAAKSVIAAALLERLTGGGERPMRAIARGTEPEPAIATSAAAGLLADGIDARAYVPTRVTRRDLASAWRVVSFGPDVSGLLPPGASFELWSDVPAVSHGYEAARDAILSRLLRMMAQAGR